MKNKTSEKTNGLGVIALIIATIMLLVAVPVVAWFSIQRNLAAYAPIFSPESLYIGAGHCERNQFEDIRYLYFDAMDAKPDGGGSSGMHWDRVFCVYGKRVSGYRIQLAFTTNKQFVYEIYNATEYTEEDIGNMEEETVTALEPVAYTTHAATPVTYYYAVDGGAIGGTYLNKQGSDEILADSSLHGRTYDDGNGDSYDNVHKYAEPIYWQTNAIQAGNAHDDFANYYILRIRYGDTIRIDRETDVICIAVKSFTVS